jgi:hypothetical protein
MPYGTVNTDKLQGTLGGIISPDSSVFRNRIINGAMVIDQRNAGASVSTSNIPNVYTLDRWMAYYTVANKFTIQQDSSVYPAGFSYSLKITSSAATTPDSGNEYSINQIIEGYNVADLDFGLSTAKTITLSFWVRSSLTGTFGGAIRNSNGTRSYPFSYTISAANTWEQKSVTIVGDTSGTWQKTTSAGFLVGWSLGNGSTNQGTAGAWVSSNKMTCTGETQIVGTNGATFYITGVQLEVGSTASSFEYRSYTTELQLCQRYLPAFNASGTSNAILGAAYIFNSGGGAGIIVFPVQARIAPTGILASSGSHFNIDAVSGFAATGISFNAASTLSARVTCDISGATAGHGAAIRFNNSAGQLLFTGCEL